MMSAVGDAVHVLPVLTALKRHSRATRVGWVLQPGPATLVRGHPAVDDLVLFDRAAGWRAFTDVRRELRTHPFDVVLDLQVYLKAGIVTAFTRAPVKLGFDRARARDGNWLFTTDRIPPRVPGQHVQDQYFEFLDALGVPHEPVTWDLGPWPGERAAQREFFARIDRPVASQPLYNALNREVEIEHLPACGYFGLGVVPYSPLARGVLTGKYRPDAAPPPDTRAGRQDRRMMESEWRRESLAIAQEIAAHAQARGITPGQFAFAWVLNNRFVTAAIGGPRTEDQWEDYAGALNYRFTAEDEALVDRLVTTGHASTPRYNDPAYPIEGRVPRAA